MNVEGLLTAAGYGCDVLGRLRRVMLHRPTEALRLITPANCRRWLWDDVPDIGRFVDEHDRYRALLESCGVEVVELADCVADQGRLGRLPNLIYLHDTAVISRRGALLSAMASPARRGEARVVKEALTHLGVPVLIELDDPADRFEGCLLLSEQGLLVADTERHDARTIRKFIRRALEHFEEVIYVAVPKARRFMHPDTIYNRVDQHLALAYPPALIRAVLFTREGAEPIDVVEHMRSRDVEVLAVSDAEQAAHACSFVPLEPGVIIHYDTALSRQTRRRLERRGVELILFHPEAMLAGGGSLRCLTLRLHRDDTA